MIADVTLIGEYSDSYEFIKEKDFDKMCEIMKIPKEEVFEYMKENDNKDKFMALFSLQIEKYFICDEDVIKSYLEQEKGNFFIHYEDKNNGYFKIYEVKI